MSSVINRIENYKGSFTMKSDKKKKIVGVVQLNSCENHNINLDYINMCVFNCAKRGAKLVFFMINLLINPQKQHSYAQSLR